MHILWEKGLSFSLVYISMKSTFPCKPERSEKMVKTSKFVSQKKKNWRQTIKTITNEFECFDVRPPLHCNFCFFLQQKSNKSCTELFLLISCLKIFNYKFNYKVKDINKTNKIHKTTMVKRLLKIAKWLLIMNKWLPPFFITLNWFWRIKQLKN